MTFPHRLEIYHHVRMNPAEKIARIRVMAEMERRRAEHAGNSELREFADRILREIGGTGRRELYNPVPAPDPDMV